MSLTFLTFPLPDDLPDMPQCVELFLDNNDIRDIADGAFRGLPGLRSLNLAYNRLGIVRADVWEGLGGLESLYLYGAGIQTLDPGAFAPLQSLYSLQLNDNELNDVSANVWEGLGGLNTLGLTGCDLGTLPRGGFSPLQGLETLSLSNNWFTEVKAGSFEGLRNLKTLNLNINQITSIEAGTLQDCPKLEKLHMSVNLVASIGEIPLADCPNLKRLTMDSNRLTTIAANDLVDCPRPFEELSVVQNEIRSLESGSFSHCDVITDLDLRENHLETFSEYVFGPGFFRSRKSPLQLKVSDNPVVCDSALCWLKRAEAKGWVVFSRRQDAPDCVNLPDDTEWADAVDLGC